MRKSILLCLVTALLALCLIFSASASENVVFLSSGKTGDGSSPSTPVGTLADAYSALGDNGGTIVFMNEYSISVKQDLTAHTGKITWTSVYDGVDYRQSGAAFKFASAVRIGLGGPTEFDYLTVKDASAGGVIAANYHDLTIGSNVTIANPNKIYLTGGANNDTSVGAFPAGKTCTIDIKTGAFQMIVAFSRTVANVSHSGTVILNMSGDASAVHCYLGSNGNNAKAGNTVFTMKDNASVTNTFYLSGSNAGTNGSVTVNMYDNTKIAAIARYEASLFPSGTRTLNYEETVTLPANPSTYFSTVNVIVPETPEEPEIPEEPEEPATYEVVFLSFGENGTGESATSPAGTFEDAFTHIDAANGGTLVLMSTYAISENVQLPDYTGNVTITSVYGGVDYRQSGAALVFSGEHHLAIGGPTVFDGITLKCTNVGTVQVASIAGNFFPLTIGEDVNTVDASGENAALLYIVGGPNNDTAKGALAEGQSSTLTIKSGSYQGVTTFSRRIVNLSHKGTMTVNISGDVYAKDIYLGSMGTGAAGGTTVFTMEGNAHADTLHLANYTNTKTNGTVTVNLKDSATVGALSKSADTYFVNANAKTLSIALTASIPSTADFGTVNLANVKYVTVADLTPANLSYAAVNSIDVSAHAADGLTLPYPESLNEFTLTLTYIDGSVNTTYTYSVKEENGTAVATLVGTDSFDGSVVYVKDGANGTGFTATSPTGSLEAAVALLPSGGTVVFVGEVTVSAKATLPAHSGAITYTSVYDGVDYRQSGARLYFPSGITVTLGGEAIFKDINIHTDTYSYIAAAFNPITFDTGVVTTFNAEDVAKDSDATNGLRIAGGYNTTTLGEITDDRDATITLKSGFFRHVHGFARYSGKTTFTGTATIRVEGTATVDELITGATQNDATAKNVNLTLSDDACIYNVFIGGQQKTNYLTGTFNFVVNGGDIYEIDALCLYTAVNCNTTLTYDVSTVPEGLVMLAEVAQIKTIKTFCQRDNAHSYSAPFASEFDASVMLKKCSICNDIQFVGDLPDAIGDNVVFVAEGGLGDGSHPAIPTSDLYAAFTKLKDSGGTIVIVNAYSLDTNTTQKIGGAPSFFQEPKHAGAITVTSVYGGVDYRESGAKFVFDGNVDYKLSGPVTFDHIVFDATEQTSSNTIAARYNPITIGEDVVMLRDMDDAYSLDLIGGYLYFRYTDFTDVEIEDELIEMVNPARPLEINPETGDYTIDQNNITYVEKEGVATTFFLRKAAGDSVNKMFADMYALGLKRPNWISYAWRGYYAQYDGYSKQVGNIRVNYPNYDFERAHKTVLQSCSLPGSSEHHLGLAIDFHDADVSDTNPHMKYDTTAEWAWLVRNAYKYGFILRFTPKDTATTGFIYEAWHFRYVGTEHALAIANLNSNGDPVANADMLATPEWCLEDYAGLVLGMYDLDSSVTVNGGTFAHVEGGSRGCDNITFTGENVVTVGEKANIMPEGASYDTVYFSTGASGNGQSKDSPVGTIEKAYALLGNDGGTIVWMSEFAVSAATELPAHEGTVTITSVYDGVDYRESGAALKYTAAIRVSFNGPTVIENFKIVNGQSSDHLICANFHPLTLGEGMVLVDKNDAVANTLTIVGGGNNNLAVGTLDEGETNTIIIKSGTYKQLVAFSAYNTNLSNTGTVYIDISGDTSFTSVIMGAKANGSKGGTTVMTLTENAAIGTVYLANGDNTAPLNGNVTIYAKGNAKINAFNHYRADLFAADARTIYYEESATLPTTLETYFDNITVLSDGERSGDANGDGQITLVDVIRAIRACADSTVECSSEADINRDGAITVIDIMYIIKLIVNK